MQLQAMPNLIPQGLVLGKANRTCFCQQWLCNGLYYQGWKAQEGWAAEAQGGPRQEHKDPGTGVYS